MEEILGIENENTVGAGFLGICWRKKIEINIKINNNENNYYTNDNKK